MDREEALGQWLEALATAGGPPACAELLERAVCDPALLAFAELLALPQVAALAHGQPREQDAFAMVQLCAFGTAEQLQAALTTVSPGAFAFKLRQLLLVTLAQTQRDLPFDALLEALRLDSDASLESLLVEAVYSGAVVGHVDQVERTFDVTFAVGRDVPASEAGALASRLASWAHEIDAVILQVQHAS